MLSLIKVERTRNTTLGSTDGRRHLRDLNPAQRSAVEDGISIDTKSPPALLIAAGAGTGKTKTLAHRVAQLILNGADPHRLLLLTFTRRAALEMTRRAHQILAEARGDGTGRSSTQTTILPWSGTFHSVGSRLLRLHAQSIGLGKSFTILDRSDWRICSTLCAASSVSPERLPASPARALVWRSTPTRSLPGARSRRRFPSAFPGAPIGRASFVACSRAMSKRSRRSRSSISTTCSSTGRR